jgi:hypothetical protein
MIYGLREEIVAFKLGRRIMERKLITILFAILMSVGSFSVSAQIIPIVEPAANQESDFTAQIEALMATDGLTVEEATKTLIEQNPTQAQEIVGAAVTLAPDSAQSIMNAAVATNAITSNDALVAALDAGADPTTVTIATSSGGAGPAGGDAAPGTGTGTSGAEPGTGLEDNVEDNSYAKPVG